MRATLTAVPSEGGVDLGGMKGGRGQGGGVGGVDGQTVGLTGCAHGAVGSDG